jgi:hypothetical protein
VLSRERGTSATPGSTLCASSFVGFLKRAKEKKPAVERRSEWKSERETTLFYISLMERRSRVSGMTNFICYCTLMGCAAESNAFDLDKKPSSKASVSQ